MQTHRRKNAKKSKACTNCGEIFFPKDIRAAKFCCFSCYVVFTKKNSLTGTKRICANPDCGKEFTLKKAMLNQKFCGRECFDATRVTLLCVCEECGKKFKKKSGSKGRFCSHGCSTKYFKKNPVITVIEYNKNFIKCDNCKKEFHRPPSKVKPNYNFCCRECVYEYARKTDNYGQAKGKKRKRKYSLNPQLRWEILKRDNFKCVYCGVSPTEGGGIILEVDHIIPRAKGGKDKMDNLVASCNLCNNGKSDTILPDFDIVMANPHRNEQLYYELGIL